jgi:hypothetical protein
MIVSTALRHGPPRGYLLLHYAYVLLAYAGSPDEEPSFPIAVVCVPLEPTVPGGALYIKGDWERQVKGSHRSYIQDSFHDWLQLLERNAGVILPQITGLSVGPFRAVGDGECEELEVMTRVEGFLMKPYRRFTSMS